MVLYVHEGSSLIAVKDYVLKFRLDASLPW